MVVVVDAAAAARPRSVQVVRNEASAVRRRLPRYTRRRCGHSRRAFGRRRRRRHAPRYEEHDGDRQRYEDHGAGRDADICRQTQRTCASTIQGKGSGGSRIFARGGGSWCLWSAPSPFMPSLPPTLKKISWEPAAR